MTTTIEKLNKRINRARAPTCGRLDEAEVSLDFLDVLLLVQLLALHQPLTHTQTEPNVKFMLAHHTRAKVTRLQQLTCS